MPKKRSSLQIESAIGPVVDLARAHNALVDLVKDVKTVGGIRYTASSLTRTSFSAVMNTPM